MKDDAPTVDQAPTRRRVEHLTATVLRELDYPGGAHGLSLRERLLTARPLRRLLGLPAF